MNRVCPQGYIWVWTQKAQNRAAKLGLDVRTAGNPAIYSRTSLGRYAPAVWVQKGYLTVKADPDARLHPPVLSDSEYRGQLQELRDFIAKDLLAAFRSGRGKAFIPDEAPLFHVVDAYHLERADGPDIVQSLTMVFVLEVLNDLVADGRIISGPDHTAHRTAFEKEYRKARKEHLQRNEGLLSDLDMEERRAHFLAAHSPRPKKTARRLLSCAYPLRRTTANNLVARWAIKEKLPFLYHKRRLWFYEHDSWRTFDKVVEGNVLVFYEKK